MNIMRKILNEVLLLFIVNITFMLNIFKFSVPINIVVIIALSIYFIVYNIIPNLTYTGVKKLKVLKGGYELLINTMVIFGLEVCIYLATVLFFKSVFSVPTLIINALVGLALILIVMWNGIIRIMITSKQLSIIMRVMLFFTWWIPLVNLFVLLKCCNIVRREYIFETAKIELNNSRKENELCKTKYPILLVHGIFWRDWQLFNYWGRIPKELIRNGATIYYGNHQSAAPMEDGANELKAQILDIVAKENCEKVNIIAHSKGGLDARYATSCLGMDSYVASLTTICTPHLGCCLVDKLLKIIPDKLIEFVANKYNSIYKKLGDRQPDFMSGVNDLTTEKCAEFNKKVLDMPFVLYQSATSKMSTMFSASFPLNVGYAIINRTRQENDGFITVESSKLGNFLGCYETKQRRGVSHGDTIDLMRKNIHGFDVCECYVNIVKDLKAKKL